MSHDEFTPTSGLSERTNAQARNGIVGLRSFDAGVITTLKPELINSNYYLTAVDGLEAPPGSPGVPVIFAYPEDLYERYKLPAVVIRRDDLTPALSRWHPGAKTYRTPAKSAKQISVTIGVAENAQTLTSWDRWEEQQQAVPYDITYTLSLITRHRGFGPGQPTPSGAGSPRNQVNALLDYVMRIYQPFSQVLVTDSIGDLRSYQAFMEATSHLDEVSEITERVIGFALTLRVEAELDLREPDEKAAVRDLISPEELTLEQS